MGAQPWHKSTALSYSCTAVTWNIPNYYFPMYPQVTPPVSEKPLILLDGSANKTIVIMCSGIGHLLLIFDVIKIYVPGNLL